METFLTRRQQQILGFLREFREREGVSPTHREIRDHFGYSSYGTVYKHLRLLREKGLIERAPNQRRGVTLTDEALNDASAAGLVDLPFHGLIAAGQPIEALPGDDRLPVPDHLLMGPGSDHYVLRVSGQSMIDEGIHDGDLVIVRRSDRVEEGDMVVALIDGEATLKRFFREGAVVRLQPANPEMKALRVPADRVTVQGQVVGLMRRYP